VRTLLVSDLHYDLRKLDWVLAEASSMDLVVVAGDLLDIGSAVPLDAQIAVVLEYLGRCAQEVTVLACSGNHDLDHRGDSGEKATRWIGEARRLGVIVDGDTARLGDWTITSCAWCEGPETLQRLVGGLEDAAADRPARWLWAYHGPPEGPLSWTGSRHYGDPELPGLMARFEPDIVLYGHIHQAPYVPGGGWAERRGRTWIFNSGHQPGPVPAHVVVDLTRGTASWWSFQGTGQMTLDDLGSVAAQ
jgi:Icc-related predicted phosphoesterase